MWMKCVDIFGNNITARSRIWFPRSDEHPICVPPDGRCFVVVVANGYNSLSLPYTTSKILCFGTSFEYYYYYYYDNLFLLLLLTTKNRPCSFVVFPIQVCVMRLGRILVKKTKSDPPTTSLTMCFFCQKEVWLICRDEGTEITSGCVVRCHAPLPGSMLFFGVNFLM
jgi:hypothetical protein